MNASNPTVEFFEGTNLFVLKALVNAYIENLGSQTVVSLELFVSRNSNIQRVYTIMLTYKKTTL
jgi:hypothetical protein